VAGSVKRRKPPSVRWRNRSSHGAPRAMPANARADVVTDHERLFERRGLEPGELRGALADGQQEIRNRRRGIHARVIEVVPPAERDGLAFAEPALEGEGFEDEAGEVLEESRLFRRRHEVVALGESRRLKIEQCRLCGTTG